MPITISNFDKEYDRDSRFDKVQFNELIANEQEVSRPSIVQPDFDDSSSNDTP